MTWLDIASDATKIGLGAIVGGAFALLAAQQAHRLRQREEYSRRRRDRLEAISESFDAATREAMDEVSHISAFADVSGSRKKREALAAAFGRDILSDHQRVMNILYELHSIEARLALLALPHISEEVEKFRQALAELVSQDARTDEAKLERERLAEFLHPQRTVIVTMMAIAYQKV